MNGFLLALTAVLIVVLSALFAAPLFIDWNDYRPAFETQASKLLGREVKVGGEVHLVLLPAPELRFDAVKVADQNGSFDQPFLEARSIEAWLNIGALLTGTIEARKIAISDPVLRLALNTEGTGNWRDVGRPGETLPFAPKQVLLDEVSVSGGRIEFSRPDAPTVLIDALEGVANAASLSGPYRASGTYRHEGRPQELRFSTSVADAEGSFHLKSVLRDPDRASTYMLDGDVAGINATPSYAGTIVYRVAPNLPAEAEGASPQTERQASDEAAPQDAAQQSPAQPAPTQQVAAPQGSGDAAIDGVAEDEMFPAGMQLAALELKGKLNATPERAELPAFELTIHSKGRSQMLKGSLALDFGEHPKASGKLAARWIDTDALLAEAGKSGLTPLGTLHALAERVLTEAAKLGEGALAVTIEQASVGGDLIGDIDLALTATDGAVNIDRLTAALPGENRLEASGSLSAGDSGPVFAGPIKLEGNQLRTLSRWIAGDRNQPGKILPGQALSGQVLSGEALSGEAAVGAFTFAAKAKLGGGDLALQDASGVVSGTKFSGALNYRGGDRRVIDLTLDSERLDLREALGDSLAWRAWLSATPAAPGDGAASEQSLIASLRDDEIHAALRVGELLLPNIPPGKLDAKFTLVKDTLDVESLDFASADAILLRGKGRIESLSDTPSGRVDLALQAGTPEGLRVASDLLGLPEGLTRSKQFASLAPLDIEAALTAVGEGDATAASMQVKGKAGGADVVLVVKAKGEAAKLADAEFDIDGRVEGERSEALLGLLIPGLTPPQLAGLGGGQGKLTLKAQGVPASKVTGRAELATPSLQAAFDGQGSLQTDGVALTGKASAKSGNAALALMLLGLEASPSASGVPLKLRAEIAKSGGSLDFTSITGEIAGEAVKGNVNFSLGGDKTRFKVDATVASLSLPSLLGSLIAWQQTPATEDVLGAITQGASDLWPARSFALDPLRATEGEIKLAAETLSLGAPLKIADAVLLARVDDQGLTITDLKGRLFGGALAASGALSPRGTGAELKAKAELKGGKLEQLSQALAGRVLAKGPFTLDFNVSGEGLSPPGLVAGLNGEGTLNLDPGLLQALTPIPLRRVALEGTKKIKLDKDQIAAQAQSLREGLTRGTYAYEAFSIPFAVKNGTLKLQTTSLANKRAKTMVNGFIELASLRLDSEWVMRLTGDENTDVPPVGLVFAGPLNDAGTITPAIDTAPIEAFLTMRRMQDDVERLETLDVSGRNRPQGEAEPAPSQAESELAKDLDAEKAAEEKRLAAEKAAEERAAEEKAAEEKRLAEEKAAAEKAAAEKAAEEKRLAEEKAAAEKAAEERAAAEKAAEEKRLAEEKAAAEKAAEEKRLAEEKAAAEKAAQEKRLAEEKAAAEKLAAEKAAAERRLAEEKAAEEKRLTEEARRAAEKAAEERRLAEKKAAEEKRMAAEARSAAEKAAEERRLAEEKAAAEKAAAEKLAAEKAAEERRLAEEKAAAEKAAADKAAAEKLAAEKAAAEKLAAEKAAAEKAAAEKRAALKAAEEKRLAEEKAAEQRRSLEIHGTSSASIAPDSTPEQLPWLRETPPEAVPLLAAPPPDAAPLEAAPSAEDAATEEAQPKAKGRTRPWRAQRGRKPPPASDDWKKGISIFGGG